MRKLIPSLVVLVTLLFASRPSRADVTVDIDGRWHLEGALHVSYMIAGGSPVHQPTQAPATGGAAIIPTARLFFARRIFDPYAALAPLFVAPQRLSSLGLVGAHDVGLSWHPNSRAWSIGTAATIAPSYMRFCNAAWCLRQPIVLYGGETHFAGEVLHTEGGGGLRWNAAIRMLTGRPTAWYWPHVGPINALSWIIGGGGSWTF